jgi:hypothetical protein
MFEPFFSNQATLHASRVTLKPLQHRALLSAMMLRDCSLRVQMTPMQRRSCRSIMRERAMDWRELSLGSR